MKKELSGGCGLSMLGCSVILIIFGILAVFEMRADGDGADGALGMLVFVAMLSPFIYWGYSLWYKSQHPDEPVKLSKNIKIFGGGALLALGVFAMWAALTGNQAEVTPNSVQCLFHRCRKTTFPLQKIGNG